MKSKKATRRALLTSVMALILCCAMLVGSTFAWFTDSVTSTNNIIKSGNLDVTLDYYDETDKTFKPVEATTKVFDDSALWEPGYTQVAYLKIGNAGSLALKYQLTANVVDEIEGINVAGETFYLSDHLVFKVIEIDEATVGTYTRETAKAAAGTELGLKSYNGDYKTLEETGAAHYVALVIYMPETVGNEANYGEKAPSIELGVNLTATQKDYEEDSFGSDYDKVIFASSYDDLMSGAYNGGTIALDDDVVVPNVIYYGANTDVTIDLNGKDISATGDYLFGAMGDNCVLTINGEGDIDTDAGYAGYASDDGFININGGTFQLGETNNKSHFYAQNSATIAINGGTFISADANTPIVYCINGFVEINGGFFQNTANSSAALLSMGNNLNYINNQKITLRGGTFVNWNPMNSAFAMDWPQCPALIVLADGYEMVSETQANGDVWYMVVPVTP